MHERNGIRVIRRWSALWGRESRGGAIDRQVRLPRVTLLRTLAAVGAAALLTGCTAAPAPEATPTAGATQGCIDAAGSIVDAAEDLIRRYDQPLASGSAAATPEHDDPDDAGTGDDLAATVAEARATRDRLGCDPDDFARQLEDGLAAAEPEGAIATAVWRRVTASLLGDVRQQAGEWVLEAGAELAEALARAAAGTTIVLPGETLEVDQTLVLLEGVTLRGAGRDATIIRSAAPDAAFVVATEGLVALQDLTVERTADVPGSGLVAGPSASVSLTDVRVTGATSGEDGVGGAGVYLSAQGDEASGRGTTLEITDSVFERNAWAGVAVAGGHRVSVESAEFRANGEVGIIFLDSASGSVSGSTFADNTVGLAATGDSTPAWLGAVVSGGTVGAQIDGAAAPTIEGLRVTASSSAAVVYGGTSTGSISGATCEGTAYGIVVADTAAPTLGENICRVARGGA